MPNIESQLLCEADGVPNNPKLPLLVYSDAFPDGVDSSDIESCFSRNGWQGIWVNGVFSYHHFHSNAHEVLGCFSGSAQVQFGGASGPVLSITAGEAVLIPAGVGHCKIESSPDFGVVGAYPPGPANDLYQESEPNLENLIENIGSVPIPEIDPVFGKTGPMLEHWT